MPNVKAQSSKENGKLKMEIATSLVFLSKQKYFGIQSFELHLTFGI
jgi:hypothetical protein